MSALVDTHILPRRLHDGPLESSKDRTDSEVGVVGGPRCSRKNWCRAFFCRAVNNRGDGDWVVVAELIRSAFYSFYHRASIGISLLFYDENIESRPCSCTSNSSIVHKPDRSAHDIFGKTAHRNPAPETKQTPFFFRNRGPNK